MAFLSTLTRRLVMLLIIWLAAAAALADSSDILAAELQSGPEYGKLLFGARCIMCHQLPDPGMLNIQQWRFIISRMQKRMALKAIPELPANEVDDILAYLRQEIEKQ